jgi:aryl-alcohol dehydrogenase
MKIKAALSRQNSAPFTIEEVELDSPRSNEVLVRIAGVGLCHTDLSCRAMLPMFPMVFGHEGSGIVEEVGSAVTKVQPKDHVVLSYASCGTCPPCKNGAQSYCRNFGMLNVSGRRPDASFTMKKGQEPVFANFFGQSSFASHALVNERNLVKVSKDVPIDLLGPLACGVQTGAGGVINSLHPHAGSSIVIFGTGSVGLSAVMGAVVCGCATIIAVDVNLNRLELAEKLGATHTINAKEDNPVEKIQELTGGGAEFSLECTANPQVFRQAVECLASMGVCGLIGSPPPGTEVILNMSNILSGRTIRGIMEGDSVPDLFIPQLISLYQQGRFPFDQIIKFYPFEEINQAVEDSEMGETVKAVLRP